MSIPALRRPKRIETEKPRRHINQNEFMILTLKNGKKLVVSSDSFHGIINASDRYKCAICNHEFDLNANLENHKRSQNHKKLLTLYPHREDFAENLIRQLDNDVCYCTICNVEFSTHTLMRHVSADGHTTELKKAKLRSFTYQPLN